MPNMFVTPHQAELLVDCIDTWVAGVAAAKDLTTEDPTIDSAEQLLDIMSGYDEQLVELKQVRDQLTGEGDG